MWRREAGVVLSMEGTFHVYVLRNAQGRHYVGLSSEPDRRLESHNEGKSVWTSRHRPWERVWLSEGMTLSEARKLENRLKRQKGGRGLYELTGLEPPDEGAG